MLESSVVDRGFEPRYIQAKAYAISMWCFSAGQATGKLYQLRLRVECTLFCYLQIRIGSRRIWRAVLVVENAGVPGENHRPWASNW